MHFIFAVNSLPEMSAEVVRTIDFPSSPTLAVNVVSGRFPSVAVAVTASSTAEIVAFRGIVNVVPAGADFVEKSFSKSA